MKLKTFLSVIFILLFLPRQGFAEGSKFDRFATDAEVTAQTRDDVGLSPSSIPHIMSAPGTVSKFQLDHNVELLNADRTILITDKPIQWYDCNGSDRNVTLPAEASSTDLVFTFYNDSDGAGEDLVIRDDTPTTLITIGSGQGQRFSCDGTSWKVLGDSGIYYDGIGKGTQIYRILAQTVTDANITLTSAHFGKSVRMSSASDYIAFLPSVGASDDGAKLRIAKNGAGKVTVDAADSDLINDSGAGDTIYNNSAETYAFIDLEYAHAIVTWIASGTGSWTTTD